MTRDKLRIALLQMHVEAGNPAVNYHHLNEMLEEAVTGGANEKPDLIMFPEMWNTGYALEEIERLADWNGARTKEMLAAFSQKHGVQIVGGSVAEGREDGVYNTVYVFDRNGNEQAQYSKIHLFRLMDEEKHLKAGDQLGRFKVGAREAATVICYDIRFPELSRKLALSGAEMLFVPAQWPNPRLHHWRTLLQARAIENQMFVIACNRCGTSGESVFFGHSMIIDPWGEVIAEAGDTETIVRAEIDLSLVEQVRRKIPVFEDRRPALY